MAMRLLICRNQYTQPALGYQNRRTADWSGNARSRNLHDISMHFRVWRRVVLQLDTNVPKQPADSIFGVEENLQDICSSLGDEYYVLLGCDAV
jgi:hypothetical protein